MKRLILSGLTVATFTGVWALHPEFKAPQGDDVIISSPSGKTITRNSTLPSSTAQAFQAIKKANATDKKGYALYENFSGWNGSNKKWVPNGWTIENHGECGSESTWGPLKPDMYSPAAADGDYYFCVSYDSRDRHQDEWLISPIIKPAKNMLLSYYVRIAPLYFYDTKNYDWINQEYVGGKKTLYTVQVMIQEEGGEWQVLRDYAEEYMEYTYNELRTSSYVSQLEKHTVDITDYADKDVRIAFRYVGAEGDTILLDAIGVGYQTLDDVWYMAPTCSLYWGFTPDCNYSAMPIDIAMYPVNAPVTWMNMSGEDASYSWQYMAQDAPCFDVTEDEYELSMTFAPERPGLTPTLYNSPVLTAEAPERIDGIYNSPVSLFTAGGKPAYTADGKPVDFTLFQYPVNYQDIGFTDVRDDKQGAYSVPVFGYNEFSNNYWLNYSLNGEEPMEGNYSHLIGIGNVFFASEDAPLVVKGMSVYGWGRFEKDAELTATIYALDSELHTDYDTYTVIARASIKGKDVQTYFGEDAKDYLYLPFHFDEPAVVQASEEHPAFLFMLEGFNSDKVEYFAPYESNRPNDFGICTGYMLHEINLQGHIEDGTYRSLKTMQYMENGKYYTFAGTFAIGLEAEYPWLTSETESIEILPEENSVSINLNSYYDSKELKVSVPDGLAASITGQHDESVLTLTVTDESKDIDGMVNIKGLGVELNIPVKYSTPNAVSSISVEKDVIAIFDMSGRQISSTNASGVYLVKYSDGKVRKVTVK